MTEHAPRRRTERPVSLTIVGWWMVVTAASSLFTLFVANMTSVRELWGQLGIQPDVAVWVAISSGIIYAAAGYGVLTARDWARPVYVLFGVISLLFNTFVWRMPEPSMLIFSYLIYGVFVYVLYRPPARAYFAGTYAPPPATAYAPSGAMTMARARILFREAQYSASGARRIFGVLFCLWAGVLLSTAFFVLGIDVDYPGIIAALSLFFGFFGLVSLAIGIVLRGKARWAGMSGWTLAVTGGYAVVVGFYMYFIIQTDYWAEIMANAGSGADFNPTGFLIVGAFGALVFLTGGGLIARQYVADTRGAEQLVVAASESETPPY